MGYNDLTVIKQSHTSSSAKSLLNTIELAMKLLVFLLSSVIALGASAPVNLQAKYPFSVVLLDSGDEYYGLHWNFTRSTESIYFAVNVSTTGWIGFGLSPNGQMTGSDVVIGWVSDAGDTYFHDRFAEAQRLPPIDESQDWFLVNSEQTDGFTILEFSRNFTTCDRYDLDITSSTDRVVWSYNEQDPSDPTGADALRHDDRGTTSVNLLGGLPSPNQPADNEPFLDILVNNVTIPAASTTYWCVSYALPRELVNTTHYINRFSPVITSHVRSYVHHVLVYLCTSPLVGDEVNVSVPCGQLPQNVNRCRGQLLVGAWAVGGDEFTYPDGIAFPIGGNGQEHFAVMEMHYDNPMNNEGVLDNSGLRFYYTIEQPREQAGILYLGSQVTPAMIIPPKANNFTITGICSADCTNEFIPEEGIRIFASVLHTHLIGRGVTIQHFRYNSDCNVLEELEPIDQNLNYDFNFQQLTYLPREHLVLPGDILVVNCNYSSVDNNMLTLGGESTLEEMCLTFPVYYPRPTNGRALLNCFSGPNTDVGESSSFAGFVQYLASVNPEAYQSITGDNFFEVLNGLDWEGDPNLALSLQDSVLQSNVVGACLAENNDRVIRGTTTPVAECSYQAPDRCTGFEPMSCCDRLGAGAPPQIQISMGITLLMILFSVIVAA